MNIDDMRFNSRFIKEAENVLEADLSDEVEIFSCTERIWPEREVIRQGISARRFHLLPGSRFKWLESVRMLDAQRRLSKCARSRRPIMLVSHMIATLPNAAKLKRQLGIPLVYSPHELETERLVPDRDELTRDRIAESKYIHEADLVVTVGQSIADWYAKKYAIERPIVLRNIPRLQASDMPQEAPNLRQRLGLRDDELLFIYLGMLGRGRRIEQLLECFKSLVGTGKHVVFIGYGPLASEIGVAAQSHANIHLLHAVPPSMTIRIAAEADVGLVGVENRCLSYYYSVPNKLFEYIMAGVPVIAPDYPDIRGVVNKVGVGWLMGSGERQIEAKNWSDCIAALTATEVRVARAKAAQSRRAFDWDSEIQPLLRRYRELLARN